MLRRDERHREVVSPAAQGVGADGSGEGRARQVRRDHPVPGDAAFGAERLFQRVGQGDARARARPGAFPGRRDLDHQVAQRLAVGDAAVAGDGPGRGRPDRDLGAVQGFEGTRDHRKGHGDRRRGVVVIFDLRLGQRRLLDRRPHHRLGAPVEASVHQELAELADDLGLGRGAHGGVGVVPVADHPEALELASLHVDPVLGEGPAVGAEAAHRRGVLVLALLAVRLLDLPFDRQAVAVPARHVDGVLAQHLLRAHHDVLEDLVERGAEMEMAVGVGRPVVEDEFRTPGRIGPQAPVEPDRIPALDHGRLALRQPRLHREGGTGHEDGVAVVGAHERAWRSGIGAAGSAASGGAVRARRARAVSQSRAICAFRPSTPSNRRSGRTRAAKAARSRRP